jgi:hypothetical protein
MFSRFMLRKRGTIYCDYVPSLAHRWMTLTGSGFRFIFIFKVLIHFVKGGYTALTRACVRSDLKMVKFLVGLGADVNFSKPVRKCGRRSILPPNYTTFYSI